MNVATQSVFRDQLLDRRRRLESTLSKVGEAEDLVRLLKEVDSALSRMEAGSYGGCEVCHEAVEDDFLLANPLIQYCLCKLTPEQQTALQNDLDLATRIQWQLLPRQNLRVSGWEVHYRYEPAGPVSGDYCDAILENGDGGSLYVLTGDVSGKGVAASLLMAHLNAMFRSLVATGLPVQNLLERANQLFGESTIASHYATLVCARAEASGEVEVCNAGHCPPLIVREESVEPIGSTGLPVGLLSGGPYSLDRVSLAAGDTLFLYTDGLTEASDRDGAEYGVERLSRLLHERRHLAPDRLAAACLRDLSAFQAGARRGDDLTIMVVRRTA